MNTHKLMATDLGKAYYITWPQFDRMIDDWAKSAVAKHVDGEGIREDRDIYIHIKELTEEDKATVFSLCLKYAGYIDDEPEDVRTELVLPIEATLSIVRECIGKEIGATTNYLIADEYGVFLFENRLAEGR